MGVVSEATEMTVKIADQTRDFMKRLREATKHKAGF